MKPIDEALSDLRKQSIKLSVVNGELTITAAKGSISATLRAELVQRKSEIIHFIESSKSKYFVKEQRVRPVDRNQSFPLSFPQQSLWLLNQYEGMSAGYNMLRALRLKGSIDESLIERCFSEIIKRHEVFRSGFVDVDGQPTVHFSDQPFSMQCIRIEENELNDFLIRQRKTPFNLESPPLLRVILLRLTEREHVLVVCMHHIISDGWSLGILIREFTELYHAFTHDRPSLLPNLPVQYADYAHFQRHFFEQHRLEEGLAYWCRQLEETPPLLEVPTSFERSAKQTFNGGVEYFELSETQSRDLKRFCDNLEVTPFMVLLAVFKLLISRYSGQRDIVIGTPMNNRTHKRLQHVIGMFVNTVAIRSEIHSEATFQEFLQQIKQTLLDAYEYQDIPFEIILDRLNIDRHPNYSPLVQIMFNMVNLALPKIDIRDLEISTVSIEPVFAKFDLSMTVVDHDGASLKGMIQFNRDLYEPRQIRNLISCFSTLLTSALEASQKPVRQLDLLTQGGIDQQLIEWNQSKRPFPEKERIHRLFEKQATATPDRVALHFQSQAGEYRSITYQALDYRSNQVANYLIDQEIPMSSPIGIFSDRSIEMIVAMLGVLKAGLVYVPLDPSHPDERLSFILKDSKIPVTISKAQFRERLENYSGNMILLDDAWATTIGQYDGSRPEIDGLSSHPAYIIYTSGSTGDPKGVIGHHQGAINRLFWMWNEYPFSEHDVCCHLTSPSFIRAIWEVWGPLLKGVPLVLVTDNHAKEAGKLSSIIQENAISRIFVAPSLLSILCGRDHAHKLTSIRVWVSSAERLPVSVCRAFHEVFKGAVLLNLYGSSEVSLGISCYQTNGKESGHWVPVGRPIANINVYLLDENNRLLPQGAVGEIVISGVGVSHGYLHRNEMTEQGFITNPIHGDSYPIAFKSGDLGRYTPDGLLEFHGRNDFQIKIRGHRIEPGEIEQQIKKIPAVEDCVVTLWRNQRGESYLVAHIQSSNDDQPTVEGLREHVERAFPEAMQPSFYLFTDSFPKTPGGKLDRNALPSPDDLVDGNEAPTHEHQTDTERIVSQIWQDILPVGVIDPEDSFFQLGGNSLLAGQVISRIQQKLGVEVELQTLFTYPTIKSLAKYIDAESKTIEFEEIPVVSNPSRIPLSFAQQRLWFLYQFEGAGTTYNMPFAVKMKGNPDIDVLNRSFKEIIHRHDVLRSYIDVADELNSVKLLSADDFPDISCREIPKDQLKTEKTAHADHVFQLEKGPLLKIDFLQVDKEEYVLLFNIHHIISDEWSIQIIVDEFITLYRSFSQNLPSPLEKSSVQYADYSLWQRSDQQSGIREDQLAFWKSKFNVSTPALDLPSDYPRPKIRSNKGSIVHFELSGELSQKIKNIADRYDVTLFMVLLSCYKILLAKWCHTSEITVGTPIANRNHPGLEKLIGFFVNTLAVRSSVNTEQSFVDFLQEIKSSVVEAFDHQNLPFDYLVEQLNPERRTDYLPLFQVWFVLQENPPELTGIDDIEFSRIPNEFSAAKFDLHLTITDKGDTLTGSFIYPLDLFTQETIQTLVSYFKSLLQSLTAHIDHKIEDHKIDSEEERSRLNADFSDNRINGDPVDSGWTTSHQERIWFVDAFEKNSVYQGSPTYHNTPLILALSGKVEPHVLEKSIHALIEKHDILRSNFVFNDKLIARPIASTPNMVLEQVTINEPITKQLMMEIADREMASSVDIESDPLIKGKLYLNPSDSEKSFLILILHHIIVDKYSLGLIGQELIEHYNNPSIQDMDPADRNFIQFEDFARWQADNPPSLIKRQFGYWKTQFSDQPEAIQLPQKRIRHAVHRFKSSFYCFELDHSLTAGILEFKSKHRVSVFATLLTAFKILLKRYSNQEDTVVGTPLTQRTRKEVRHVIGPIANLAALRGRIDETMSFLDLIAQTAKTVQRAVDNSQIPFDVLVGMLNPTNDMSRTALFDILFQYRNSESKIETQNGDLQAELIDSNLGFGKYDISLSLNLDQSVITGSLVYNDLLYDDGLIRQMADHLKSLLEQLLESPFQSVSKIETLTDHEKRLLYRSVKQKTQSRPSPKSLHKLFEEQVEKTPEKIAVTYQDCYLTYRELNQQANRLAHCLHEMGAGPDVRIAISLERSIDMIEGILGILKSGAAYVPIEPSLPQERLTFLLDDSESKIILTHSSLTDRFNDWKKPLIHIDQNFRAEHSEINPDFEGCEKDSAYIIYTSGSTGTPKGVEIEHRNVTRLFENTRDLYHFDSRDVWTLFHSFGFDFSVWEIWGALLFGGKLVIVPRETTMSPDALYQLLVDQRVTILNQTPSSFYSLMETMLEKAQLPPFLRQIVFGGEALDFSRLKPLYDRFEPDSLKLTNMYGITETTVHVTHQDISAELVAESVPGLIGVPLGDLQVFIINNNQIAPMGVPGEVHVAGPGLARGYLNQKELTSQRFVMGLLSELPDLRLYKTGDSARYLPDGNLQYLGRIDNQVKIRGYRIELGEIESVLKSIEYVKDAVVTTHLSKESDKRLVAYLAVTDVNQYDEQSVVSVLKRKLPDYMIPAVYMTVKSFSLTPNGKIDLKALPEPVFGSRHQDLVDPATTTLQKELAAIWKEILPVDEIGINDNFFDIGGHSLMAAQIITRIRKKFNITLEFRTFFTFPTIRELTQQIEGKETRKYAYPLVAGDETDKHPLSYPQQRLWLLNRFEGPSTTYNVSGAFRLRGMFNVEACIMSFEEIAAQHKVLQSKIVEEDVDVYQIIDPDSKPVIRQYSVSESEIDQAVKKATGICFDLKQAPLLDIHLIKVSQNDHVVVLVMHHMFSDGWSLGILIEEFNQLYSAFCRGLPSPLEESEFQYYDFAVWQRNNLRGKRLIELQSFWKDELSGLPSILPFPTDFPRPKILSYRGATEPIHIPLEVVDKLETFGRQNESTLFTLLLAAFKVLLAKYTGSDDIPVGTLVANRLDERLENLIGNFVNTLVIRSKVQSNMAYSDFVSQVRDTTINAYDHQDLPFDVLVDLVNPKRGTSYHPLVQVNFVLQNTPGAELKLPDLDIQQIRKERRVSLFDFRVDLHRSTDGVRGFFEYSTDLFEADTIRQLILNYQTLILDALDHPNKPIKDLHFVTDDEQSKLLFDFNRPQHPPSEPTTVIRLFEEQAAGNPDQVALEGDSGGLTYAQLNNSADLLAWHLAENGIKKGDNIGICLSRSSELIVALLGVLKIGAAFVPIDLSNPKDRIELILRNCLPKTIIALSSTDFGDRIPKSHPATVICIDKIDFVSSIAQTFASQLDPEDRAYLIYTSGSTGEPKGVEISHAGFSNYIGWAKKQYCGDNRPKCFPLFTSIAFDLSITSIFLPLVSGGKIRIYTESDHDGTPPVVKVVEDNCADVIKLTPSHLALVLHLFNEKTRTQMLILGGEELKSEIAEKLHQQTQGKVMVYNEYGPTESTVGCAIHKYAPDVDTRVSVSIGRPIDNTRFYILNNEHRVVPRGVIGELYMAGEGLAKGYYNDASKTEESFVNIPHIPESRLYKSGDLVRYLSHGNLELIGRKDRQIKLRGYRIEMGEIETAILKYGNISASAVSMHTQSIQTEADGTQETLTYCVRCGLPSNIPNVGFNSDGVCDLCIEFEEYREKAFDYFGNPDDLKEMIEAHRNQHESYDCIALFSGGKDSTYMLNRLVEMGFRVLAYTFDNGYIIDEAKDNIRRTVEALGIDHVFGSSEYMQPIFYDSLQRYGNVCNNCFKMVYAQSIRLAKEKGIHHIVTGLSRGQLFETRLMNVFTNEAITTDEIDDFVIESRKFYHRMNDSVYQLESHELFDTDAVFNEIDIIDFFRYDGVTKPQILGYLKIKAPWFEIGSRGCTSNCSINDVGIYVHQKEKRFHNYALPNSWEVRLGHMDRQSCIDDLNASVDEAFAEETLQDIGYRLNTPENSDSVDRLIAYYSSSAVIDESMLKDHLKRVLPDYMIPHLFVSLMELPTASSGKIDYSSLPIPTHFQSSTTAKYVPPTSSIEKLVTKIWNNLLGLDRIGIYDDFFELGGNSLIATQIISRLEKEFNIQIPIRFVFQYTKIFDLAEIIETVIWARDSKQTEGNDAVESEEVII